MTFRAALTYHPDVGTFRGGRGAWRVAKCWPALVGARVWGPDNVCVGQVYNGGARAKPALFMDVPRRLAVGIWVNPTKLLRELLDARRLNAAVARANRCPNSQQRRYA